MCIVAYLRVEDEDGVELSFVIGKCRIAQMKQQTIPKLELQAALYSVRLRQLITEEHDIQIQTVAHWTESMTVLQRLHSAHKRQQVFVANRVGEILDQSTVDEWRHVKWTMNPADIGTRGVNVSQLLKKEWLNGPAWLKQNPGSWPEQVKLVDDDDIVLMTNPTESVIDWSRFSKYKRMINVVVYCLRFRSKQRGAVTALERQKVELTILLMIQRDSFAELFKKLEEGSGERVKHDLAKLSPFVDSDNTIRLRGRLSKATVSKDLKHPILLSAKHPAVILMLRQMHEDNHHEGTEYLRSLVQQRFWVIGIRSALRSITSKCVRCRILAVQPIHRRMADSPKDRVVGNVYPFKSTGIEYFGPFEVTVLRRPVKHWCCLFTCFVTRAVHIEVVNGLDTDACMMAITRFMARRGRPHTIISDNGTNFVGAAREFRECFNEWDRDAMCERLASG